MVVKGRMHPFSDPFELAGTFVDPLLVLCCRRLSAITPAALQTTSYYEFVVGRVNKTIRRMTLEGKIAGGECWVDAALNKAKAEANEAYFDYKLGFFNVAETLVFRQHTSTEYNNEIIDRIAA